MVLLNVVHETRQAASRVVSQHTSAVDLRDVTLHVQHNVVENSVSTNVNDVVVLVDKVTFLVY